MIKHDSPIVAATHAKWVQPTVASTFLLALLVGCAGSVSRQDVASFDAYLAVGNYPAAAQTASGSGRIAPDGRSDNLAWSLDAGAALLYAGEPSHATRVLDAAESLMKSRDLSSLGNGQYEYATYDGVMVNVYKALAFLGTGDKSNARVEFNRVVDRQSRAEAEFAKQKAELDAQAQQRANGNFDLNAAVNTAQSDQTYLAVQAELGRYANYRPFINPAASYLRALYLLNNADTASDLEAARVELARVSDMAGPSPLVSGDLALARAGNKQGSAHTWVVFENGQAPTFVQYDITFPVPVIGRGGSVSAGVVTVAMPRMVFHPAATGVLKAGLQTVAAQTGNRLVELAALVISNVSTADTRSWTALPKGFQAARIDVPQDGTIHLTTDSGVDLGDVLVPAGRSYVKEMTAGGKPSVQVYPL